jgi:tetratricopeptide (TPR) repeat protein
MAYDPGRRCDPAPGAIKPRRAAGRLEEAMPDLSVLAVPLLGAIGVFVVSLMSSTDIAMEPIRVPQTLEEAGFTSIVMTRMLTDDLRKLNEAAEYEESGLKLENNFTLMSFSSYEDFFGLSGLVAATRALTKGVRFFVNGDVTGNDKGLVFRARVLDSSSTDPVTEFALQGDPEHVPELVANAARQIMVAIDPYVLALNSYGEELRARHWDFSETREILRKHIETPPIEDNYLAFELIGRMHQARAELDTTLTPQDQQAESDKALEYLQAAYVQNPEDYYTNFHLGEVYAERGQYRLADKYLAKTIQLDPNDIDSRRSWAQILEKQGRFRDAAFQYVAAVELAPDDAALHSSLATAYLKLDRPDAARAQWERAHVLDPLNRTYAASLDALPKANP